MPPSPRSGQRLKAQQNYCLNCAEYGTATALISLVEDLLSVLGIKHRNIVSVVCVTFDNPM